MLDGKLKERLGILITEVRELSRPPSCHTTGVKFDGNEFPVCSPHEIHAHMTHTFECKSAAQGFQFSSKLGGKLPKAPFAVSSPYSAVQTVSE